MSAAEARPPSPVATQRHVSRKAKPEVDRYDIKLFMEEQPAGYNFASGERGKNLTYGELTFDGVLQLLRDSHYRRGGVIPEVVLDLGAGTGKVPLTAAAVHSGLRLGIGIELVKDRYRTSIETRDALDKKFPILDIKRRTLLLQGDIRTVVAAIAAADVIWVANTCYGEELNKVIADLIDDYAPDGALVYMCVPLKLNRASDRHESTNLEVSWAGPGHGVVAALNGVPFHLADSQDEEMCSADSADRAFERWANSDMVINAELLRTAVAAALLRKFPAEQLLRELHTSDGELASLCEETSTECPEGIGHARFGQLCEDCHQALYAGVECGLWNFSDGGFLSDLTGLFFLTCSPRRKTRP